MEANSNMPFPSPARLLRGRAAATACTGQDQCGMCAGACGFGAIKKPGRMPIVCYDLCIGCGACVKACPRMNMRLVDGSKGADVCEITVKVSLDDLPGPEAEIRAFDTAGNDLGPAHVVQAYPLPDGRNGIVRFRAERGLLLTAVRVKKA